MLLEYDMSKNTVFRLGFLWAFLVLFICVLLTLRINNWSNDERKLQESILKRSAYFASLTSFGIWTLQLVILGWFLNVFFQLSLYIILFIIYLILFKVFSSKLIQKEYAQVSVETKEIDVLSPTEAMEAKRPSDQHVLQENEQNEVILSVQNLCTHFYTEEGIVKAVENVSFDIYRDEIIGLVGETGCGKSVTALSIIQLIRPPGKIVDGQIIFANQDILKKSQTEMLKFRGNEIGMIFQDPLNSLNPVFKVGHQLVEVFELHKHEQLKQSSREIHQQALEVKIKMDKVKSSLKKKQSNIEIDKITQMQDQIANLKSEYEKLNKSKSIFVIAKQWAIDIIRSVGIADPEQIFERYPFELSGGMRQRIMIGVGLACSPKLLIADEPTTALDVTIQADILDLLSELKSKLKTSIMIITHDLGVISEICDRVAVMYAGYIVELASVKDLFKSPLHPYTHGLIQAIPRVGIKKDVLNIIPGSVPNLIYPPNGCRFHPRCQYCFAPCKNELPQQHEYKLGQKVSCHLYNPKYFSQTELQRNELAKLPEGGTLPHA